MEKIHLALIAIIVIIILSMYFNAKVGAAVAKTQAQMRANFKLNTATGNILISDALGNLDTLSMKEALIPAGSIMMWNAAKGVIPSGWALCDGTNNTPDLRDKFILGGKGDTKTDGAGGGSFSKTLTVDQLPAHSHQQFANQTSAPDNRENICGSQFTCQVGRRDQTWIGTSQTGGNQPVDITPPFVRLSYIMKL